MTKDIASCKSSGKLLNLVIKGDRFFTIIEFWYNDVPTPIIETIDIQLMIPEFSSLTNDWNVIIIPSKITFNNKADQKRVFSNGKLFGAEWKNFNDHNGNKSPSKNIITDAEYIEPKIPNSNENILPIRK